MAAPIVTRIAPSPTGRMHIGTVRTALFNYLFAKQNGGEYLVRIEDTDRERSKPEWAAAIWEDFAWCGLQPDKKYVQSEHLKRHQELLQQLVEAGKAYVSKETAKDDATKTVEVVRLKNAGSRMTFTDLIRGEVSFDTAELGDFVIARSIDDPLYHFAVVVDDADAGVTHVIRAEEHLSNTPRQILIQEALGFTRPIYAHIPLILAADRSKLSKRHGAVSISEYRERGFIPEALINYLALLGWHPAGEQEIYSLAELVKEFTLENVQKGGAVFDEQKLLWFNHEHLKRLSAEEYAARFGEYLDVQQIAAPSYLSDLILLLQERAATLQEAANLLSGGEFSFMAEGNPTISQELLLKGAKATPEDIITHMEKTGALLNALSEADFTAERAKEVLMPYATEVGRSAVLWPLRVALSGQAKSPDPFTIAALIGKEKTLSRLKTALTALRSQ